MTEGTVNMLRYSQVVLGVCAMVFLLPVAVAVDPRAPTAIEVTMLPKFCWGQFNPSLPKTPEFTIQGCGVYMNHYCYGLVSLQRLRKPGLPDYVKRDLLRYAKSTTEYTVNGMKNYPQCYLRSEVETTLMKVNAWLAAMP